MFRRQCRKLRKLAPLSVPVRIRRCRLKNWCGRVVVHEHSNGRPKHINIYVSDKLDLDSTIDTLIHEWAHALAYDRHRAPVDQHDGVFWLAHGEVYRAWHETE